MCESDQCIAVHWLKGYLQCRVVSGTPTILLLADHTSFVDRLANSFSSLVVSNSGVGTPILRHGREVPW